MEISTIGTPIMWIGFTVFVLAMLAVDLGLFHRKAHEVTIKEAAIWSAVWVSLAALFGLGVYLAFDAQHAVEFATGYLIEKALAVDNIFIFVVIFGSFAIPRAYQHRILFWGVIGALLMRAAFIWAGAALLAHFHWVFYVFGAFLVFTCVKLLTQRTERYDPEKNLAVRLFRRFVPMTTELHDGRFLVRQNGVRRATPLLLVLVIIEVTDVIFALDSIPAIFAVTSDPFIVFTSNIFAILGLRSMYFLLSGMVDRFHHLKTGLALILGFVGLKMLLAGFVKIPVTLSLGVIVVILAAAIGASMIWPRRHGLHSPV